MIEKSVLIRTNSFQREVRTKYVLETSDQILRLERPKQLIVLRTTVTPMAN